MIRFIQTERERISEQRLREETTWRAAWLRSRGEKIAAFPAERSLESLFWILAAWFAGKTAAPLSPGLGSESLESVRFALGPDAFYFEPDSIVRQEQEAMGVSFDPPPLDADWTVIFSSGTSGRPKAVALSGHNLKANAEIHRHFHGSPSDAAWLASLPLFHVGGLCILSRALFLEQGIAFPFSNSSEALLGWMKRPDIHGISLVPTQLKRIFDLDPSPGCAAKTILLGGAPCPGPILERAIAARLPVKLSYGMTESCSQVVCTDILKSVTDAFGYSGKPAPSTELRISESGEIELRGPSIAEKILQAGVMVRTDRRNGFFPTGDAGALLANGGLCVYGRGEDIVVSGGEKISVLEVESCLSTHPDVSDCAACGLPDGEWGSALCVAASPRDGCDLPEDAIKSYIRNRLGIVRTPKHIRIVKSIPRNEMNKIIRQEVRALFL